MYGTLQASNTLDYSRHWNILSREAVYVPSPKVFKAINVKLGKTVRFNSTPLSCKSNFAFSIILKDSARESSENLGTSYWCSFSLSRKGVFICFHLHILNTIVSCYRIIE